MTTPAQTESSPDLAAAVYFRATEAKITEVEQKIEGCKPKKKDGWTNSKRKVEVRGCAERRCGHLECRTVAMLQEPERLSARSRRFGGWATE